MASLLDWDLEAQVYPIVRWLVHHQRAKIVDMVHRGLKTVFTLPIKFESPYVLLSEMRNISPSNPHLDSETSRTSSDMLSQTLLFLNYRSSLLQFPALRRIIFMRR